MTFIFKVVCDILSHLYVDSIDRDPLKALQYLERSCSANHGPSCFNLAVLYKNGDVGVNKSDELFKKYKQATQLLVEQLGNTEGKRKA